MVGNHSRENIKTPGRTLWIGGTRGAVSQCQVFQQWNDVDAVFFEHGTLAQIERMQREAAQLFRYRAVRAGKKARANPMRDIPDAQVEAGGLDLIVGNR